MALYLNSPGDFFEDASCAEAVFLELDSLRQGSVVVGGLSQEICEFGRSEGLGTNRFMSDYCSSNPGISREAAFEALVSYWRRYMAARDKISDQIGRFFQ